MKKNLNLLFLLVILFVVMAVFVAFNVGKDETHGIKLPNTGGTGINYD